MRGCVYMSAQLLIIYQACPGGQYKDAVGNVACTNCPGGSTTTTTGNDDVSDCVCAVGYAGTGAPNCSGVHTLTPIHAHSTHAHMHTHELELTYTVHTRSVCPWVDRLYNYVLLLIILVILMILIILS